MGTEHSGVTDKPQTVFAGRLEAFGLASVMPATG